ncbi:MAG TPA: DUF4332 domain-containing protein [Myxococcota bacterium]|nr:DUF4332 domain-containing protein [Myxococcota bacterium]HOD06919.1 DUF4332 domain-containing protein [Myxococcota bacterium]HPB50754.1 DUF4332 domain-containing protein [Myxococcota bacterium]HQP94660.1 DUF4332 domain-containing protein [Myxococcota bacterium]
MKRGIHVLLLAIVLSFLPVAALAGHYDVAVTGLVDETVAARLAGHGIRSTRELWDRTRTSKDRASLAAKMKVKPAEVQRWHDFCDLLRLDGVGPKVARIMTHAGVSNLSVLVSRQPDELAAAIVAVRDKVPELGKLPDRDNLQSWINQAAALLKSDAAPAGGGAR